MTPELAAFSDWVLALLPRLFLYPGGLWMVAGVAVIRFAREGRVGLSRERWIADLAQLNPVAAAIAWVGLALTALPGVAALPAPVDRWVPAALLSVSLLLSLPQDTEARKWRGLAGAGIAMALLAPLAGAQALTGAVEVTWAALIAFFAVGLGITALIRSGEVGFASEVRSLAWIGLAIGPVWDYLPDSWLTPTVILFLAAAGIWRAGSAQDIPADSRQMTTITAIQLLLALAALQVALLVRG